MTARKDLTKENINKKHKDVYIVVITAGKKWLDDKYNHFLHYKTTYKHIKNALFS